LTLQSDDPLSNFACKFNLRRYIQARGRRRSRGGGEQPLHHVRCRPRRGLSDDACHVILHMLDPRFPRQLASYDAARVVCLALGRGVTRSKQMAMRWVRKAAENGRTKSCLQLASGMYEDRPYAREVGHVVEAAGIAASAGFMDSHDVPSEVMTVVVHWLRKGGYDPVAMLAALRIEALEGSRYCENAGCGVVGHLKAFKVCPQCKTARYCSDACQKQDWTTGGHKTTCGTFHMHV